MGRIFYPEERIAMFVDGANLYSAAKTLGFDIDYKKLLDLIGSKGRLVRADPPAGRLAGLQRLHDGHQTGERVH